MLCVCASVTLKGERATADATRVVASGSVPPNSRPGGGPRGVKKRGTTGHTWVQAEHAAQQGAAHRRCTYAALRAARRPASEHPIVGRTASAEPALRYGR